MELSDSISTERFPLFLFHFGALSGAEGKRVHCQTLLVVSACRNVPQKAWRVARAVAEGGKQRRYNRLSFLSLSLCLSRSLSLSPFRCSLRPVSSLFCMCGWQKETSSKKKNLLLPRDVTDAAANQLAASLWGVPIPANQREGMWTGHADNWGEKEEGGQCPTLKTRVQKSSRAFNAASIIDDTDEGLPWGGAWKYPKNGWKNYTETYQKYSSHVHIWNSEWSLQSTRFKTVW